MLCPVMSRDCSRRELHDAQAGCNREADVAHYEEGQHVVNQDNNDLQDNGIHVRLR